MFLRLDDFDGIYLGDAAGRRARAGVTPTERLATTRLERVGLIHTRPATTVWTSGGTDTWELTEEALFALCLDVVPPRWLKPSVSARHTADGKTEPAEADGHGGNGGSDGMPA